MPKDRIYFIACPVQPREREKVSLPARDGLRRIVRHVGSANVVTWTHKAVAK